MESTLQNDVAPTTTSNKSQAMLYWIVTAIFCLQMSFNRLCSIASFSSCASVRPPWLSCLFQGGAIMGQVPGCAAFAYAGAPGAQGMGLCWFRHHDRNWLIVHIAMGDGVASPLAPGSCGRCPISCGADCTS